MVRSSREARAAFYAVSGLAHLEAASAPPPNGPASRRMRGRALRLLSDLLELSYEASNTEVGEAAGSEDDAVEHLATSVLPQFASAALHLLGDADGLKSAETALLALRTITVRRPEDGVVVLRDLGGLEIMGRALAGLGGSFEDVEGLGGEEEGEEGEEPGGGEGGSSAARRVLEAVAAAEAQGDGGNPGLAGSGSAADEATRRYLATLCADVLQDLVMVDGDVEGEGEDDVHDEL